MAVPAALATDHRAVRADRIRDLLSRRGLGAAVLRTVSNFAWFTGGGDSRVDHASQLGVADVVVTADAVAVLASSIETPRMRAEQAAGLDVVEFPWHEGPEAALRELTGAAPFGADTSLPGAASDLSAPIARMRRVLGLDAIDQLEGVGADTSAAFAEAAMAVEPGANEHDIAAALAYACRTRGLVPHVLLVGADERIARFCHPLPAGATVRRRALLATSAERGGLYANVTRIVELEEPHNERARRRAACDEILGRMRDEATVPGTNLADA